MKSVAEITRESLSIMSDAAPAIAAMMSDEQRAAAAARERIEATAPELLEACKAARALTPDGTYTASVLDAAIAKAEGRE